jgi:hypothetical protein
MSTTYYHLTAKSDNVKTGPIPVSTTSSDTCPPSCGQYETCYAKYGLGLPSHWRALSQGRRGTDLDGFVKAIKALPAGTLWRHNQAGDLPGHGEHLDTRALSRIVSANKGKRGFTFTHKDTTSRKVAAAIKAANAKGFTINISADSLAEADKLKARHIGPVAIVLPGKKRGEKTANTVTPARGHSHSRDGCER